MEHELVALIHRVDGLDACSVVWRRTDGLLSVTTFHRQRTGTLALTLGVQAPAVPGPPLQRDGVAQQVEKLVEALAPHLYKKRCSVAVSFHAARPVTSRRRDRYPPLLNISSSVSCPSLANRTPNLKLTEP